MPWPVKAQYAKGVSGNPRGRPVGKKNHVIEELEKIARADGGKEAQEFARKLWNLAKGGDIQAGRLVLERLYGRVATAEELAKRADAPEATKMAPDQRRKKLIDLLRQPEFRDLVAEAVLPTSESVQ